MANLGIKSDECLRKMCTQSILIASKEIIQTICSFFLNFFIDITRKKDAIESGKKDLMDLLPSFEL